MNFKKLKRLLSIALSVSMILSSNLTGLAAQTVADPTAATEESQESGEHEHDWQLVETLKNINRYACSVEGCEETKIETSKDNADEEVQTETAAPVTEDNESAKAPAEADGTVMTVDDEGEEPADDTKCQEHAVVAIGRKAPTCLEKGMSAYYTCNTCKVKYRTRNDAAEQTNPIPEEDEDKVLGIEKRDHRASEVAEKPATCTKNGNTHYYTCPLCDERYESIEKLYADTTENRTCIMDKDDTIIAAKGHAYVDDNGKSTVKFDGWDTFSFKDYKEGQPCGISAYRTCVNEHCDVETGYVQRTELVAVTKIGPDADFDCTAGGDENTVTYRAIATFNEDEENFSVTGTATAEQEDMALPVSDHAYIYAFTWNDGLLIMDDDGMLDYDMSKITVTRKCNICNKKPADTSDIDVKVEWIQDGEPVKNHKLSCLEEAPSVEFTATATVDGEIVKTDKQTLTLPIGRHTLDKVEREEPSCDKEGRYEHFHCTICQNDYWDESEDAEPLKDKDIKIAALGHNFDRVNFIFDQYPVAVAVFTCKREDATVRVECAPSDVDLESGDWKEKFPNAKCGDTVNVTYDASVEFDGNTLPMT